MTENVYDVAIVGGGMSGLFSGWRLATNDLENSNKLLPLAQARESGKLRVGVFERSHRVGGRLESITPPGMPGHIAEVGGMRFMNTQRLVSNLIGELGLITMPFPVGSPDNIYYLRGHHFRDRDFGSSAKIPYHLNWHEDGKTPGEIILDAITQVVPGAVELNQAQWRKLKKTLTFNGEYLYNLGFWNLLLQVISSEAYHLCKDAGGYFSTLSNWNAADALPWYLADFGPDVQYNTIQGGMEQLPQSLASRFTQAGGELHTCLTLKRFDREADGGLMRLTFDSGETVRAHHLILAMPRRSLELIAQDNGFLDAPELCYLIPTVTPNPMFKLFLCFDYPWWELAGVRGGRSTTDLPIRQTYYVSQLAAESGSANPAMRRALMMASYDDGSCVGFWEGLEDEDWRTRLDCDAPEMTPWERHSAPPVMVAEARRQLRELHDIEVVPQPYAAAFKDWREDPFGGAWNSWNVRVKSWEVRERMLQPLPDWPVHIVGEAYSESQGWVEGALQTAEELLEEKFNLERPDWLSWA